MCKIVSESIFVYYTHFYFHDVNPLHSVMFLCFCKVPHNFQSIDPKLWFFRNLKSVTIKNTNFTFIEWPCHHLREYLKTTSNRPLRCSYVNVSMNFKEMNKTVNLTEVNKEEEGAMAWCTWNQDKSSHLNQQVHLNKIIFHLFNLFFLIFLITAPFDPSYIVELTFSMKWNIERAKT